MQYPIMKEILEKILTEKESRNAREIELSAARSILDVLAGRIPFGAVNDPHKQFAHAQSRTR